MNDKEIIWIGTCQDYYEGTTCTRTDEEMQGWNHLCCYGEGGRCCRAKWHEEEELNKKNKTR